MAKKPAIPCTLRRGKFLGGQKGFVDTFNWLVSFCSNFSFDRSTGMKLDMSNSEKPVVKTDSGKGASYDAVEVVVRVEYDTATHTFTQYKRKLAAPVKFADKTERAETVFVATEIDI